MTLEVQFMTMLSMIAGGFYLGIACDTFRRLSISWNRRVFLKYFMEISFWLTQTLLLYYVLFQVNSGELRFYVFAAVLLGFAIYQALVAKTYKTVLEHLIRIMTQVYQFVEKMVRVIIIAPVKFIFQSTLTVIIVTLKILLTVLRYSLNVVWSPIFWLFRAIYKMFPQSIQKKLHKIAGFYSTIENTIKKWFHNLITKRR
ncbi:spore cortex biosynthesis protein YabQ [Lentibacillus kapialis]|uniref:spore cortex biosynthesis protein YabQ n=1 Tax=Lentibacillus kapialis TaxID=340214 RepID=UPI0016650578|nr:spore cortex biosynthesis protein YabQ [Lentibacillus kapialis]